MSLNEADYLALLAKKTVWCPNLELLESEVKNGFGHGNPEGPCSLCKGLEETLDPQFDKLRWRYMSVESYGDDEIEQGYFQHGDYIYCIVRDLGILLEIAAPIKRYGVSYSEVFDTALEGITALGNPNTKPPTAEEILEAAAHAVHNWIEAQESKL